MEKRYSFALISILRQNRRTKEGLVPVYLRISVDCKRAEVSTRTVVPAEKWMPGHGRVKGNSEEAKRLNQRIINFEHRAREIYHRFIERGQIITADTIKNELLGTDHKQRKLLEQFKIVVKDLRERTNLGFAAGTVRNWVVTEGHLEEFLLKHYHVSDITFKQLDKKFIADFEWFARTNWGCGNNAALKHIQRIRKVVRKAVSDNWLVKDPFMGFEGKQSKTHRTFLTDQELEAIKSKTFDIERLDRVKDVFVFCCYTGLAHIDVEKLTPDNLVIGIDGKKWIYTFREKTDIESNIPLLPEALSIIEKYQDHPACLNSERLLPVISNIKTNAYLKEIATVCGIKKNLTFHMARHTFATTITLTNGVPIETVSNMLGHSKITTTQIYAKVLENKVSEDMWRLQKKLAERK